MAARVCVLGPSGRMGRAVLDAALGRDDVRITAAVDRPEAGGLGATVAEGVHASADLEAITAEIGEQVRLLDGLVRYRFGDNAELMGAWGSARNVVGPVRSSAEPEGGVGETPEVVTVVG